MSETKMSSKMSLNGPEKSSMPEGIPIKNPFIHSISYGGRLDKIRTIVFSVLLLPFRTICLILLLLLAWVFAYIGLYGISREELMLRPVTGWRRLFRKCTGFSMRGMFWMASFQFIEFKGHLASAKEAPVIVAGPHTSFYDAIIALVCGPSSVVAKSETATIPFLGTLCAYLFAGLGIFTKGRRVKRSEASILVCSPHSSFFDASLIYLLNASPLVRLEDKQLGKLIDYAQPIYVCREDPSSRHKTIQDIIDRANSIEDWPQILVFPEGTCTNRTGLIQFKPGAFYPGVPVQPICIRYPNKIDSVTWTWQGPEVYTLLWRTLTQFHTFCEIEFLPVYKPSEEEKNNPKLFAENVRKVMSNALEIPLSDYSFDDCKLLEYAKKCGMKFAAEIADLNKLRIQLGLTNAEELIVKSKFRGTEDHYVNFSEFVQKLRIPANSVSATIFKLFTQEYSSTIDFKEYLLHAIFLSNSRNPKIEFLELLFMLYSSDGQLQRDCLQKALSHVIKLSPDKINSLFVNIDVKSRGYITFDEFCGTTKEKSDYSKIYS